MDRVVLRVPMVERGGIGAKRKITSASIAAFFAVLVFAGRSSWSANHFSQEIASAGHGVIALIFAIILIGARRWAASRRLVEAAVEITPIGVQLVSTYGSFDGWGQEGNTRGDGQGPRHRANNRREVRTFLPRGRILDVVVVEVVWPHCVWSQLTFRVLKSIAKDLPFSTENLDETSGNEQLAGAVSYEIPNKIDDQIDGDDKDGPLEDTRQCKLNQSLQPQIAKKPSIHTLLRQNKVSIVPAFPEECRGMLTYEQCLRVQTEIENLLHIS